MDTILECLWLTRWNGSHILLRAQDFDMFVADTRVNSDGDRQLYDRLDFQFRSRICIRNSLCVLCVLFKGV